MFRDRTRSLVTLAVALVSLAAPPGGLGQAAGGGVVLQPLDLEPLLRSRDPSAMIADLTNEGAREQVEESWAALVMDDSEIAGMRNKGDLYPNPSLQAYVNRLGQTLVPRETSENVFVSFKIVEDPLPYADALATGTVFLSSGLVSLLDNEAQLAFLLMHEAAHVLLSHHLYQIIEEVKAEKKAKRIKMVGAAAGVVASAGLLRGGMPGGDLLSAAMGGGYGFLGASLGVSVAGRFRDRRFTKEIELESDQFAAEVILQHGIDAREAPVLLGKLEQILGSSNSAVDLAFANRRDLANRSSRLGQLLSTVYRPVLDRVLEGEGVQMSSPRFNQLMAELKRDNGLLALESDLFAIATANLEEAAAVRTDDPQTMYGLALLYRAIGRTDEEVGRTAGYLKSAMEFDELRHWYPEAHLQYAVELLSREDPRLYPEIQKALRTYVVLYQRKTGGDLPREMRFIYDYLDLTGDRSWIAYGVSNVSTQPPYQLAGEPKLDRSVEPGKSP